MKQTTDRQHARFRAASDNENGVMSFSEIAARIGTTEGTAKITHYRALQKLRRAMESLREEVKHG